MNELEGVIPDSLLEKKYLEKWADFLSMSTPQGGTWRDKAQQYKYIKRSRGLANIYSKFLFLIDQEPSSVESKKRSTTSQSAKRNLSGTNYTACPPNGGASLMTSQATPSTQIAPSISYDGYVYCFSNPAFLGLLKIGFTKRDPHERARELSTQGGAGYPRGAFQ